MCFARKELHDRHHRRIHLTPVGLVPGPRVVGSLTLVPLDPPQTSAGPGHDTQGLRPDATTFNPASRGTCDGSTTNVPASNYDNTLEIQLLGSLGATSAFGRGVQTPYYLVDYGTARSSPRRIDSPTETLSSPGDPETECDSLTTSARLGEDPSSCSPDQEAPAHPASTWSHKPMSNSCFLPCSSEELSNMNQLRKRLLGIFGKLEVGLINKRMESP